MGEEEKKRAVAIFAFCLLIFDLLIPLYSLKPTAYFYSPLPL